MRNVGGGVCTSFGMALNRRWRRQDGSMAEETSFVDCEVWGRTAEIVAQYARKGNPLFCEGYLKQDVWKDQNGKKQSRLRIRVENVHFVGGRSAAQDEDQSAFRPVEREPDANYVQQAQVATINDQHPASPIDDSDLPF